MSLLHVHTYLVSIWEPYIVESRNNTSPSAISTNISDFHEVQLRDFPVERLNWAVAVVHIVRPLTILLTLAA